VTSGQILVDSSVWIHFFRSRQSGEARALDALLAAGPVATCGPVRAEVVSGARSAAEFQRLQSLFDALIELPAPADLWQRITLHRFTLARRGSQVTLIDLMIAVIVHDAGALLWTRDEDFNAIAKVLPLARFDPARVFDAP